MMTSSYYYKVIWAAALVSLLFLGAGLYYTYAAEGEIPVDIDIVDSITIGEITIPEISIESAIEIIPIEIGASEIPC